MKCVQITSDSDLSIFTDKFAANSGIKYPPEYLRLSSVYAVYKDEEMVGGFLISEGENIRWAKQIPFSDTEFYKKVDLSLICEVNGAWLDESIRGTRGSINYWGFLTRTVAAYGKPIPTLAYLSDRKGLASMYTPMVSGKIYEGPMLNSDVRLTVCYSNIAKFRFFKIVAPWEHLLRWFRNAGKKSKISKVVRTS